MSDGTSPAGALIWSQQDMARPETFALPLGSLVIYTARAPGKTVCSEDALALIPVDAETCLFAVADGVGGQPAGEEAAKLTLETLCKHVRAAAADPASVMQAIMDGAHAANHALLAQGSNAATTLAVAEVRSRVVRTYHVGDSMILITDQRGKLELKTVAHSPVGQALAEGVLNEAQALHHPQRNLVSNVVGMPGMRVEIGPSHTLAQHDTLLLASDGLTDNLYVQEIATRACGESLHEAAQRLLDDSRHRMLGGDDDSWPGHADDLSFMLFRPRAADTPEAPSTDG